MILPNYHEILVIQRQQRTGCIPSGIEWMLKYLKIKSINFDDFQERYDLTLQNKDNNNFDNVSELIMQDYSYISFSRKMFDPGKGKEKIDFVKDLVSKRTPVLISIAMSASGERWHIVPVVEISDKIITVLWMIGSTIEKQRKIFNISEIEFKHNNWPGGQDILYCTKTDNL